MKTSVTLIKYKSNYKIIAILNDNSRLINVSKNKTPNEVIKFAEKIANSYKTLLIKENCKNDYFALL